MDPPKEVFDRIIIYTESISFSNCKNASFKKILETKGCEKCILKNEKRKVDYAFLFNDFEHSLCTECFMLESDFYLKLISFSNLCIRSYQNEVLLRKIFEVQEIFSTNVTLHFDNIHDIHDIDYSYTKEFKKINFYIYCDCDFCINNICKLNFSKCEKIYILYFYKNKIYSHIVKHIKKYPKIELFNIISVSLSNFGNNALYTVYKRNLTDIIRMNTEYETILKECETFQVSKKLLIDISEFFGKQGYFTSAIWYYKDVFTETLKLMKLMVSLKNHGIEVFFLNREFNPEQKLLNILKEIGMNIISIDHIIEYF
uniref:Uncharacterized protein n=1 Tax=viral metagenome TaxID=1070528 RepID=A0A6C0JTN5_9ZZZZ